MVNFLFDRSQTPSMSLGELCDAFGVKQSKVGTKSRLIRDLFHMYQFDPEWTLPSKMDDNPLAWMISVDGLIIDVRYAPPEIQLEDYRRGLIPYLPQRASGGEK